MIDFNNSSVFKLSPSNMADLAPELTPLLVPGEELLATFKGVRDSVAFTNKRLIALNVQGITGKKVEIYSLPYSSVNMWSTENAGTLDFNAEVELWTRAGHIKIKLGRGIDVRRLDNLLAYAILNH